MAILNRSQILSADDLKTEDVDVPAWGGTVRVRTMTGKERDDLSKSLAVAADGTTSVTEYRIKLLAHTIVGEDGALLFTESDLAALENKSAAAIFTVCEVADRLNSVSGQAIKAIEKNSEAAPSGESSSVSA